MPVIACCEAHDITTGTTQFVKTSDAYLERRAQQRRSASPARIMGRRDDHHQLEEGCELMLDWRKLHKVATCGDDVVPVLCQRTSTTSSPGFVARSTFATCLLLPTRTVSSTARSGVTASSSSSSSSSSA